MVLDEQGQQHLLRSDEQQVGERRGDERPPQPDTSAHEAEPLSHVREGRRVLSLRVSMGWGPHQQQRQDRDAERARVDQERAAGAPRDQEPTDGRTRQPPRPRADELVERVRLDEQSVATRSGTIASNAGPKNAVPRSVEGGEHHQVPQLQAAGEGEQAHRPRPRCRAGSAAEMRTRRRSNRSLTTNHRSEEHHVGNRHRQADERGEAVRASDSS
jgi:hypothetical protein